MREDTRRVGCVPSAVPVKFTACGLWSLTPDKMIKRQEQVKPQTITPTGSPPTTPFTVPSFFKMDYSPLQGHNPHFSASTSLFKWLPSLKGPSACQNPIISQSVINTSSFKIASLVSFLNSLPDFSEPLLSFIHSKNIFQVLTMTLELSHVLGNINIVLTLGIV